MTNLTLEMRVRSTKVPTTLYNFCLMKNLKYWTQKLTIAHWSLWWPNRELHRIGGRKIQITCLELNILGLAFTKALKGCLGRKMALPSFPDSTFSFNIIDFTVCAIAWLYAIARAQNGPKRDIKGNCNWERLYLHNIALIREFLSSRISNH